MGRQRKHALRPAFEEDTSKAGRWQVKGTCEERAVRFEPIPIFKSFFFVDTSSHPSRTNSDNATALKLLAYPTLSHHRRIITPVLDETVTTHSSEASGTHHSLHSLPGRNSDNATALKLPAFPTTLSHHHTMTTPPSPTDDGTFPRSLVYWAILLSSTLTSGTAFGWPSLKLILEDEGVMRDACPGSNATFTADCTARQLNFTTIYMGGFFSLLASRLLGVDLTTLRGPEPRRRPPFWQPLKPFLRVLADALGRLGED